MDHDFSRNPFKKPSEMTEDDWRGLGLRTGLEIHQQLLTERKLFCRCKAGLYSKAHDAEVLRHMRPTLSELGEYDGTALMEFKTKKEIVYLLNRETVCTYEMDDAPPFEIDDRAVDIAIEVALLLNLNLIGELHIARKQYLDGSIPTGFQRTTILGINGSIPYKDRRIGIRQLGLEEDACREVENIGHRITFRTDRLGMPLIETVTEPEMLTPVECMEVGEILRALVRATGKVRTGIGAGREDVNVSIAGGTRIEIKGVDSLRRIPLLVYNEAMRQWNLLRIQDILRKRGITPETFDAEHRDVTGALLKTSYIPIRQALENGERMRAIKLVGFAGILREQTQTMTAFAREISERVRVIACLHGHPNFIHSDSLDPTISNSQWHRIRKKLKAGAEDAVVVVWGSADDILTAAKEVVIRAQEATEGVPSETRCHHKDGTNGFERILPGADRMYPDTDLPPIEIKPERVATIRTTLPKMPWELSEKLVPLHLPRDVVSMLVIQKMGNLFEDLLNDPPAIDLRSLICRITQKLRHGRRKLLAVERITPEFVVDLSGKIARGEVLMQALTPMLDTLLSEPGVSVEEIGAKFSVGKVLEPVEVIEMLRKNQADLPPFASDDPEAKIRWGMGLVMPDLVGKLDAREVEKALREME